LKPDLGRRKYLAKQAQPSVNDQAGAQ